MLFPVKPQDEILNEMMQELEASTGINDFSPGSVARSLLEIIARKIYLGYNDLNVYGSQVFLSTSSDYYLDLIGSWLDCQRNGDGNDSYKYRIANRVYEVASSNELAIKFACLSIAGVKDIIITKYTHGSGSFSVHVITDEVDPPQTVLDQVKIAVDKVKAEGIRAVITKPTPMPIDVSYSIKTNGRTSSSESLEFQIKSSLKNYIDYLGTGAEMSIQQVISKALENSFVTQAFLSSFRINDESIILRESYKFEWDERPYIRNVSVTIM